MSKPDLQPASVLKPIAYAVGGIITLFSVAVGVVYMVSDDALTDSDDEDSIFQRGLPSDFFWSEEVTPKTNNKDDIPVHLQVEEESIKVAKKKKTKKKKTTKKAKKKVIKQETVTSLFGATTLSKDESDYRLREIMNESRRGSGSTFSSDDGLSKFIKNAESKDDNWKKYGLAEDFASYPVDMARVITADRNLRCILIEEISSELEGKITCLVEENVYGAHGRLVLIPAGSKAIGYYKPLNKTGDSRLFSGWTRIITPAGININLSGDSTHDGARLADAMGRSGMTGEVDNKYFEKYGLAFMIATLNSLAASQIVSSDANQQIVIQNYGRELSQLSNTILNENINIKPVVRIPAGSRILISPLVDIWFQPPAENKIETKLI